MIYFVVAIYILIIVGGLILQKYFKNKKKNSPSIVSDSEVNNDVVTRNYFFTADRWKTASNIFLYFGISILVVEVIFNFLILNRPVYLYNIINVVFGIFYIYLSFLVRKHGRTALKTGIFFVAVGICGNIFSLSVDYFLFFLVFFKLIFLYYLWLPLKDKDVNLVLDRPISKIPFLVPALVFVPCLLVFYILYLIYDNILVAGSVYIVPLFGYLISYLLDRNKK